MDAICPWIETRRHALSCHETHSHLHSIWIMSTCITEQVLSEFQEHVSRLREALRSRKDSVRFKSVVDDNEEREAVSVADTLGVRQPSDVYDGDVNLRTLRSLLNLIDERGWERCANFVVL